MREFEKCECVSSAMTISPMINMETQIIRVSGILHANGDGVFVYICRLYSDFSRDLHHMHLSMTVILHKKRIVNGVVQSLIIDLMHPFV